MNERAENPGKPAPLGRRTFFKSVAAAGISIVDPTNRIPHSGLRNPDLIDVNVNFGHWPTRRLRFDDPADMVTMLRRQGVMQAWVGNFDGLLHKDIGSVNARLMEDCRRHGKGTLVPFGSINPMLPDWEEDLRRCIEQHKMPGIRLHPNYHGYKLDDRKLKRLLQIAADRRMIVQIALAMEDDRTMHPLLRVEQVDPSPITDLVKATTGLRLVLLNALRILAGRQLQQLLAAGDVYVEIAMLEGIGGIGKLLAETPSDRILFGSHAPFFYFESSKLKLRESPLTSAQLAAIQHGNARRLIASARIG